MAEAGWEYCSVHPTGLCFPPATGEYRRSRRDHCDGIETLSLEGLRGQSRLYLSGGVEMDQYACDKCDCEYWTRSRPRVAVKTKRCSLRGEEANSHQRRTAPWRKEYPLAPGLNRPSPAWWKIVSGIRTALPS